MTMKRQLLVAFGTFTFAILLGACSSVSTITGKVTDKVTDKLTPGKSTDEQVAQPRTDAEGSLQVGNLTRLYDLHVPSTYTPEEPLPLVIAFHGAGGDGRAMEQFTGLSQLAEQEKFIVVYPDAIARHWDSRRRVQPEVNNDIGFISALIDELGQQYNLDRNRIYATGFSNGGMFAHRVACELSDKIAASAAVAASMPENLSRTCQPTEPIPMLMIHGTNDPVVPYGSPGRALLSLEDTVKFWSSHNSCAPDAMKDTLPTTPAVRLDTYQQCANETTVMLYTVEGGEHTWPKSQAEADKPEAPNGINATTIIWDFFTEQST